MRLIIYFSSAEEKDIPISFFNNKFAIQGLFYSIFLKSDKLVNLHFQKGFKHFCFSDVAKKDGNYFILFSSPNNEIVKEVKKVLRKLKFIYIGYELFKLEKVKLIKTKVKKSLDLITGSPVVVYVNNRPFNFFKDKNYSIFFERLKENAIKKYKAFYNEDIKINDLFDEAIFNKSVAIPLNKNGKKFLIFGSMWKSLKKYYISKEEKKFYRFLIDEGLGEKNSLGFGFLNIKK
ncbi:MAG: CRISPR-associated endoribonuclease Cas6 [Candidatus Aenigmatarchaeota archaeon]